MKYLLGLALLGLLLGLLLLGVTRIWPDTVAGFLPKGDVHGQLLGTSPTGKTILGAGRTVYLARISSKAHDNDLPPLFEAITAFARGRQADEKLFTSKVISAACDSDGRFRFYKLEPGPYVMSGAIYFDPPAGDLRFGVALAKVGQSADVESNIVAEMTDR